jgi:MerR family transcriptional regulator, light-induced transcriptional regulator
MQSGPSDGYHDSMPDQNTEIAPRGVSIAVVSELLGIPVPTIRSWERRYGLPAPRRTNGRHRRYGQSDLEQLRALRDLVTKGLAASDAVARLRGAVTSALADPDLIDDVVRAAMDLNALGVREALDRSAGRFSVEDAIRRVALPAMHEIGTRWKAGTCDVGQEHLATEAVRTWLARQVSMAPPSFRRGPIVLACGPSDLHSIGLEAFAAILARRGWSCRVLGAMTPASALVAAAANSRAVAAVVTSQRGVTRRAAVEAIDAVDALPGIRAFYAGDAFATLAGRKGVSGVYLGEDVVDAALVLEQALGRAGRPRSG